MEAFIRKNTQELRDKLQAMGCDICPCATWEDSKWLDISISKNRISIHGIGYWDETCSFNSVEEALKFFLHENEHSDNPAVDCGEDEEKFLGIVRETIDNSIKP